MNIKTIKSPYQNQLSLHSCVHQAGHFQVSNPYGPPYACDNNPHQKGFVGIDADFLFHPAKKIREASYRCAFQKKIL